MEEFLINLNFEAILLLRFVPKITIALSFLKIEHYLYIPDTELQIKHDQTAFTNKNIALQLRCPYLARRVILHFCL